MKKKVIFLVDSIAVLSLAIVGVILCANYFNNNLKPKYYQVTFNTMGGNKIPSVQVLQGTRIEKPEDPVKEGFTFTYWVTYYGHKWDFAFQVVNENMTLKAQWTVSE